MCRIGCIKSKNAIHPSKALYLMSPQQEGHDNSGFAIVMTDLEGIFKPYKDLPLLSYSSTFTGKKIIEAFMVAKGFNKKFVWEPKTNPQAGQDFAKMEHYGFEIYDYPTYIQKNNIDTDFLVNTRLELRKLLEQNNEGYVFSFWPDTLTIKEIGNPSHIGEFFGLWEENEKILGKNIMIQYRQNTNYDIVRYAAHPFFLQGYTLCANGENTFYVKNKEYQQSLHLGYVGFESDSQCFLYSLHYVKEVLKWPLNYFKHVITPLPFEEINNHPDKQVLYKIRESLGHLEINGPNTVIGLLPDHTLFTCCDSKKLRPVVVGTDGDMVAVTSEVTGLNIIMPQRNAEKDIYPNERETVVINNQLEIKRWKQ